MSFISRVYIPGYDACATAGKIKDEDCLRNSFVYVSEGKAALRDCAETPFGDLADVGG